ncbi:hypothetical protein AB0F91_40390 [Amycolatopsis sp. NPDC023774]|uniref:hypothetical protein n=1 Tax=Amycolatopsis sp. NPDC023774 TaxID=3155015 RepID=UPI0033EA64FD
MPDEVRAVDELRAEGFIQDMFFLQPRPGVVTLVEAPTREAAETKLGQLPFVALGLMEFDLAEVIRR